MELLLNEQQAQLAETAARLAREAGGAPRSRALRDGGIEFDRDAWRRIADAGWLGITAGEAQGGLGLGLLDAALAVEEAGRRLLMVPLAEAAVASFTLSRTNVASAALECHIAGERPIVPACDPAHWRFGGVPQSPGLVFDAQSMSLSGGIGFVPFAQAAGFFLVATNAGREPVLALVDAQASGLSRAPSANVDGSTAAMLSFDRVAVAAGDLIARGEPAARLMAEIQDALALLTAVELLGLATAAHEVSIDYIKLRQQFGKPIGSFQAIQHRAVNGMIDIELNRSLIYRVLADFDRGAHHPAMVPAAKARAARVALEVTRVALQMHGAVGYTDSADIGLYYKRAIALAARYGGELHHIAHFSELTQA